MIVKVKIIKLAGETGLLKPGSFHPMEKTKAKRFEKLGYVSIIEKPKKVKQTKK